MDTFVELLADYSLSAETIKTLQSIDLVILFGITGSGRNTIINHLVDTGRDHFVVSDTTRPPKIRDGKLEQDGIQYNFRSEEEVLCDIKDGKYLEAEIIHNQQVSGISISELERAKKSEKVPINEVDIKGTVNILKVKPDTKMFFIVPPSYDEWIKRLDAREQMSQEELSNRINTALRVLRIGLAGEHFRFVINESSLESSKVIDKQVVSGSIDELQDKAVRQIAQKILLDIERHHVSTP